PNYPQPETVLAEVKKIPQHVMLDADKIAKDLGNARAANMVILGAASPYLGISFDKLEAAIRSVFGRKGEEIVNLNLAALRAGAKFATN
ncbi:MAG: 2-oxoacid:acceptor oxidoreductase family protein, partial [Bacteroidales bacterium]|nr:2-oxoacid:acceptor oxidoreductase family protein [Bacteroidales bacterium]